MSYLFFFFLNSTCLRSTQLHRQRSSKSDAQTAYLTNFEELLTGVFHRVFSEGRIRYLSGPWVPAGKEGLLFQTPPVDPKAFSLSPTRKKFPLD